MFGDYRVVARLECVGCDTRAKVEENVTAGSEAPYMVTWTAPGVAWCQSWPRGKEMPRKCPRCLLPVF